jgi:hypothetical protein
MLSLGKNRHLELVRIPPHNRHHHLCELSRS